MPTLTRSRRRIERPEFGQDEQARVLERASTPIPLVEPRLRLPRDEELARLLARYREVRRPANLFQSSFTAFRERLCYTVDEAAGGMIRKFPSWPVLREVDEALILYSPLLIEKSRRVLASWVVCAFDLWLAAGGQDARWPALMNATGNRQIIVGAQRIDGLFGSAWYLGERIKPMLLQFEARGFRRMWPDFPTWEARHDQITFSNGSKITAIPQGADQARGGAATLFHVEELAAMEEAGPTIGAAIPILRGGGHIVCLTTPQANTYAHRIVSGKLGTGLRGQR